MRELDRRRPDTARSTVHEERLALLQTSALEDVGPDREIGFRNRGRVDEIHPAWNLKALRRRRDAVLGVAAARDERADRVACLPLADAVADRLDRSGDFQTG